MKKLILAAAFCTMIMFILGICLPLLFLSVLVKQSTINETFFWVSIVVLCICLSVILTTMLLVSKYANDIDDIEGLRKKLFEKDNKLNVLINKYNNLLFNNEG